LDMLSGVYLTEASTFDLLVSCRSAGSVYLQQLFISLVQRGLAVFGCQVACLFRGSDRLGELPGLSISRGQSSDQKGCAKIRQLAGTASILDRLSAVSQ